MPSLHIDLRSRQHKGSAYLEFCVFIIIAAISFFPSSHIVAATIDEAQYRSIMELALLNFWGKAQLPDGSVIQPSTDIERRTMPIPIEDGKRIINYSKAAGIARWCGLDHRPYFQTYMAYERSTKAWSDKQIAFVGLLFGVGQGVVEGSLRKGEPCDETLKSRAMQMMQVNATSLGR